MNFKLTAILVTSFILITFKPAFSQSYKVLESSGQKIKIEFDFNGRYQIKDTLINNVKFNFIKGGQSVTRNPGDPWLPDVNLNIAVPFNSSPTLKIINAVKQNITNKLILPFPDSLNEDFSKMRFNEKLYSANQFFPKNSSEIISSYVFRYIKVVQLSISPYQFNPLTRELLFNRHLVVEIDFQLDPQNKTIYQNVNDKLTSEFVKTGVINSNQASNFISKEIKTNMSPLSENYWYNPNKNYYKIYLNKKGIYRVTYDWLVSNGVPANTGLQNGQLEIINNGNELPLDIVDVNNNGLFDSGDYFQFAGDRAQPTTPYTYFNIYNTSNVYWFSYQADSVYKYKSIDGYPNTYYDEVSTVFQTKHFEQDISYQTLGHAPNDHRDYWLWGNVEARDHQPYYLFRYSFGDSLASYIDPNNTNITLKVNMQGMTAPSCTYGHDVIIKFNGYWVDSLRWNAQDNITGQTTFPVSIYSGQDSIPLNPFLNKFEAEAYGYNCDPSDQSRMNWFEVSFWRKLKVNSDSIQFISPPSVEGLHTVKLWRWFADNMKIYIPSRGKMIDNPYISNNSQQEVYFNDTLQPGTQYYCYSNNVFYTPDSMKADISSDLRNPNNAADYIIITHSKFESVAQRLAQYRSNYLPGYANPRVKIVNIKDVYDEFSYGLRDPLAMNYFLKYAFENWQSPSPAYVVLVGDMSHDYRHIYSSSRENYIASIPFQAIEYGQAPSDNMIVAFEGNDVVPDMIIGRISCETVDEGNIILDKTINYPADNNKEWKQNVLLLASGLNYEDQLQFGFNAASNYLDSYYLEPNGIHASKVFNFPATPEDMKYQGSGPEMRHQIDNGTVLTNYYGHGGGGQWDLVFTNDDIYELHNGDKLPVILSVTCYTGHFDDQDCFGEKFIKVPDKGCVGFWGSTVLTLWSSGQIINNQFFKDVFSRKDYVVGQAILKAKTSIPPVGGNATQIAVLSYLGDPALKLPYPKNLILLLILRTLP